MRLLKEISNLNRKIPKNIRFILSLIFLNIPVITYLTIVGPQVAPIYVAAVFLLINIEFPAGPEAILNISSTWANCLSLK